MEITIYSNGCKNVLYVPKELEYLFDKYPLYKAVEEMNKEIERLTKQKEIKNKSVPIQ